MRPIECEFETEVLAAVLQSRWPERVDVALREHVSACTICAETALVAGAIDQAREEMRASFAGGEVIPDSGRVWWLAQLRARREAIEAAGRPITAAQLIALVSAIGLLVAWITSSSIRTLLAEHAVVVSGMAAVLLLVPAAAYFAMGKE